ncbi:MULTISPECIES: hypothetical protein [unclassified Micromonospora]
MTPPLHASWLWRRERYPEQPGDGRVAVRHQRVRPDHHRPAPPAHEGTTP